MITAIGNPVFDTIQTHSIRTDGRVLSGCSTNFCLALSRLGVKTTLAGNIGPDFRERIEREMSEYGIDYTLFDAGESGGFHLRYYGGHGERELTLLGDAGPITEVPDSVRESDFVVFGPILSEVDKRYMELVREITPAKFVLDPQGILRKHRNGNIFHEKSAESEILAGLCSIVKPNELECEIMTGYDPRKDARTPAEIIHSWGPDIVIITLAEKGSVVYNGSVFTEIPPFVTEARDSTGAGDTYLAGFMYGYMQGWDLFECGCMGSAVASVMIENTGPDFPLTLDEAMSRQRRIVEARTGIESSK